jgi:hypothetical protein
VVDSCGDVLSGRQGAALYVSSAPFSPNHWQCNNDERQHERSPHPGLELELEGRGRGRKFIRNLNLENAMDPRSKRVTQPYARAGQR